MCKTGLLIRLAVSLVGEAARESPAANRNCTWRFASEQ